MNGLDVSLSHCSNLQNKGTSEKTCVFENLENAGLHPSQKRDRPFSTAIGVPLVGTEMSTSYAALDIGIRQKLAPHIRMLRLFSPVFTYIPRPKPHKSACSQTNSLHSNIACRITESSRMCMNLFE